MEFTTYTLPNGIRGIHRRIKGNVTHCALLVNAGSRDELKHQFGLAHFTEHALFKGTEHRKAYQVNCRLENLGGELNAFTTKEDTTIHATTLRSDFSKAVELIADVAFHSTFPDRELEKEKEIIYDEINTYKDSPADMIYDTFEEMLFAGSELGHNILGRKSSLARFSGESIREFVARTHTTDQMVFSSIGNLSAKSVETTVARYLSGIIAGMKTETNKIGYVAAMQIPECIYSMNAYFLGARSVNPDVTMDVLFTNTWYDPTLERQAADALLDLGCRWRCWSTCSAALRPTPC
mgnify:CR=1 FL=1